MQLNNGALRCTSNTHLGTKKKEERRYLKTYVPALKFLSLENLLNLLIPFTVVNNVALYTIDNSDMTDTEEH